MKELLYIFATRKPTRYHFVLISFAVATYVLITGVNLVQLWSDPFDDFLVNPRLSLSCTSGAITSVGCKSEHVPSPSQLPTSPKVKIILYWNAWNPTMGDEPLVKAGCPVTECLFTSDLTMFNQSDVVLFSAETTPDFVVDRMPHQRFVFFILESPVNTKHLKIIQESRTRHNYFNWTMTYRQDSDIVLRDFLGGMQPKPVMEQKQKDDSYFAKQYPPRIHLANPAFSARRGYQINSTNMFSSVEIMKNAATKRNNNLVTFDEEPSNKSYWFNSKTKMVAWFVSHCDTPIQREEYARQLSQYVPVDIYGNCGHMECGGDCNDDERLRNDYKFYLAFENSWCPDYVTEKFYRSFKLDVVPIVLSGADYERFAPPHSYINVLDFATPKDLADYLLLLNSSDSLYARYFDWREHYEVTLPAMDGWCDLCQMAHDDSLPPKVYHDIKHWWEDDAECENDRTKYF